MSNSDSIEIFLKTLGEKSDSIKTENSFVTGIFMRSIIFILILVLIGLQYRLWLGDGNIFQWQQVESKITAQTVENKAMFSRNRALEADIMELKIGDQALEEQARYELGMIKDDEVYYQFLE